MIIYYVYNKQIRLRDNKILMMYSGKFTVDNNREGVFQ